VGLTVLDPTRETAPAERPPAARAKLAPGDRVALLDIGKARGDVFLDEVERLLGGGNLGILRLRKPTFARAAPADLRREIAASCQAVIVALAD